MATPDGRACASPGSRAAAGVIAALLLVSAATLSCTAAGTEVRAPAPPAEAPVTAEPAVTGPGHTGRAHARRPNIVVVMADDMRVDDLRFAPNLRRLVGARGLTFRNSFSSYPLCCPARASFLTGAYAHNHRVFWHSPPFGYAAFDDSRTLATSLSAAGYRTGFIGKYLNGYGPMRSLVSGSASHRYVPRGWSDWRGALDAAPGVHGGTYNYFDIAFNVNGRIDNTHFGEYSSKVIGDMSVRMADRFAAGRRPFFMYVNYVAPHLGGWEPGDPPAQVWDRGGNHWTFSTPGRPAWVRGRFDDVIQRGAGMPRDGGPSEPDTSDKPPSFSQVPEPSPLERVWLRDLTRQRAEAVFVMDLHIARLIVQLKQTREWRNTVLMFTSDNGYFLGEHRRRTGKVRAHEPSLRVPFLVTGPGMRSGEDRFDPISTVDVAATILDLGHAKPPGMLDGASRVPTMRRGDRGWSVAVLTEAASPGPLPVVDGFTDRRSAIGIRTGRYSLIVNRRESDELYDLLADPLQNHNVFDDPDYRSVRSSLLKTLTRLRNCRGPTCRARLPAELRLDVDSLERLTRHYWAAVDEVYGWR